MKPAEIAARIEEKFPNKVAAKNLEVHDPWLIVAAADIETIGRFCHDDPDLALDYLRNQSAVDYLVKDEKKAKKLGIEPKLEIVYHLFSFRHKHDFALKVQLPRWKDGVEGSLPEVPSVWRIWRSAEWHEREIYDLMGVKFANHPNLRRILCPEDWVGHPLRKDYVFPLEYHGIRG